jgi:hypothetical protein
LGAGDDATTGLRADGPIRSINDANAPMTAAASVTAPAPNASRRPLSLRRAGAGPPGNGGPSSRSSWRRISSIARLSWSVSCGSSGYVIAMASLRPVACIVSTIRVPPNTRRSMARPARECNGTLVHRVRPAADPSCRGAAAQQSSPGAPRPRLRAARSPAPSGGEKSRPHRLPRPAASPMMGPHDPRCPPPARLAFVTWVP